MEVYKGIAAVTRAIGREGIGKDRKNQQQGYNFRGIDDIYNALSGCLADANLCIIPRVVERTAIERQNKSGGALFYVTVHAEYDIVSAVDGSKHTASAYGEAMDSGDKATNKAMSAAYKYMAMQLFCIPTEGDNDADATTHEVRAQAAPAQRQQVDRPRLPAEQGPANAEAAKAEGMFYENTYDLTGGAESWPDVQKWLGTKAPKPTTVEQWREAYKQVKSAAQARQQPQAA